MPPVTKMSHDLIIETTYPLVEFTYQTLNKSVNIVIKGSQEKVNKATRRLYDQMVENNEDYNYTLQDAPGVVKITVFVFNKEAASRYMSFFEEELKKQI